MTLYSVLAANTPLPTIDCTGIAEITVKELKKLYPITEDTPEQPWHSMPDDAMVLRENFLKARDFSRRDERKMFSNKHSVKLL